MKTPILAPVAVNHSPRQHSGVERLEGRIAPAAIVTPASFTYTDANGDMVKVQITGKAGSADFLDGVGGDVAANGGDLAKIVITKPSPDFAIAFTDTNAATGALIGDNLIELGNVVGPGDSRLPAIKGIFTADSSPGVAYHLGGFFGTDFSFGGGLKIVGQITGDGNGATTDVNLKSLGKGTEIFVSDSLAAGATIGIDGTALGNLTARTVDGDVSIGTVKGLVQIGHIGGTLTVQKDVAGKLVLGDPDPLALPATEEVTVKGSVLAPGIIDASQDLLFHVTKDFSGSALVGGNLGLDVKGSLKGASLSVGDALNIDIAGPVAGSAIVVQHGVQTGSAFHKGMASSSIVGGTGLDLAVTGSVAKARFSGGTSNLTVTISGKVAGSQFLAGGDATVTTGFAVDSSSILPDGRLTLNVGTPPVGVTPGVGDVTKSVIGSKSTSAIINIGGKVAGSQFTTGTDLDLTVGKSLAGSIVQCGNNLTQLNVATDVVGSRVAVGSDASVTIGGRLASSALVVSNNLTAMIGQAGAPVVQGIIISAGVSKSRIETSDGSSDLTVVGPVSGTVIDSGRDITLSFADLTGLDPVTHQLKLLKAGTIGSDVFIVAARDVSATNILVPPVGPTIVGVGKAAPKIVAGDNVDVNLSSTFAGAINASNDVTLKAKSVALAATGGTATVSAGSIPSPVLVPGGVGSVNVAAKPGIRAGGDLNLVVAGDLIAPLIDVAGNVNDFRVGGALNSGLTVSGNFIAGTTTAAATVVGGIVSPSSFIHIGGDLGSSKSAPELIFDKGFAGRLEVSGSLLADLTFNGAVNRIAIDGRIGPATPGLVGDVVADIIVKGKLTSFSSGSIFTRTSASGGNFVDAAGTITGVLQADGGAASVGPFLS